MVTDWGVANPKVVTAKTLVFEPPLTVTLAGTVAAAVLLLARVTTAPAADATPVRVTVPVVAVPPTSLVGLSVRELKLGAFTVNVASSLTPAEEAVMVTDCVAATPKVVTPKTLVAQPALTVTLAGTVAAAGLLLEEGHATPAAGTTPLSVTIPVLPVPPITLVD